MIFWTLLALAVLSAAVIAIRVSGTEPSHIAWGMYSVRLAKWEREPSKRRGPRPDAEAFRIPPKFRWGTVFWGAPIIASVIAVIASFVIYVVVLMLCTPVTAIGETKLVALGNGTATTGTFFLASGTVDDKPVFRYITDDGADTYSLHQIDADEAKIIQDGDGWNPRMIRFGRVLDAPWWVGPDLGVIGGHDGITEFHVPHGTITQSFNVSVTPPATGE